jgi:DNA mismatch endonuclease (patch repair protein)
MVDVRIERIVRPIMDIYSREKRSELMSKVRTAGTTPELIVRRTLHSLGFRFRLHGKYLPGKPDIVLPKYHSVIFVHGCFWHHHRHCKKSKLPQSNAEFWRAKIHKNVERDSLKIAELIKLGWRVLVIWECETKNRSFEAKLSTFFATQIKEKVDHSSLEIKNRGLLDV